ncbi:copper resistance protein CopC [Terrabacter sp. LjRoot27]|uniref:copper resistance CopC/CopD family protein n=1 Tax=Terrabacter sp. LjRoot27 TaxID=3342306 RepID=UPI003ECD1842
MNSPARRSATPARRRAGSPAPRVTVSRPALARSLGLLLLVLLGIVGAAGGASAHSTLERSDPPNGGMVASSRTTLTLWFGEPITMATSSFSVRGDDLSAPPVATTSTIDADHTVVHLRTPTLANGTYTITWAVVAEDGHPTRGTIVFGVGFRPDGVPAADSAAPDAGQVALRFADLAGTLVAIGALAVTGQVVGALGPIAAGLRRRVLAIGAVGAAVALAAAAGTAMLTARTQAGSADASVSQWLAAVRDALLGSSWGLLWIGRLLMLAVALVGFLLALRSPAPSSDAGPGRRLSWLTQLRPAVVAGGALVVAAGLDGWAGHASTVPMRSTVTAVAATLHVLAAGIWAGALLVLVLTVVPLMRTDPATRRSVTPAAWRAFSPMAAISTVVLVATGLYETGRHVETVGDVTRTVYGTAVVAKLLLVAVALALAGYNTVLVNPGIASRVGRALRLGSHWRPRRRRLADTVAVESLVLAVAVAVAALMTSVPTAREVRAAQAVTAPHSATIDGLFVTFEAVPLGADVRLTVRVGSVVRPQPAPPTGVEVGIAEGTSSMLTTTDGQRVVLTTVEAGRWEGSTAEPTAADWTAEVVVHRTGRPDSAVLVPWSSRSADTATPLELAASGIAVAMCLGLATVVVIVRRRRTTGSPSSPDRAGGADGGDAPREDREEREHPRPTLEEVSTR